ncbi:hypothetical protein BHM03_00046614, partial [Ensete ventricosum]
LATCPTCLPSSFAVAWDVHGTTPPGGTLSLPACLLPASRLPRTDAPIATSRAGSQVVAQSATIRTSMVLAPSRTLRWLGTDGGMEFPGPAM